MVDTMAIKKAYFVFKAGMAPVLMNPHSTGRGPEL